MKKKVLALVIALSLPCAAAAQMGEGMMMPMGGMQGMPGMGGMAGMTAGPAMAAEILGPEVMAACHADLGQLGLPADVQRSLEEKAFEMRKQVIRTVADLLILKLELARQIERRSFDAAAARRKADEITQKEGALRALHIDHLAAVAAVLTDEQWERLRQSGKNKGMTPASMMQMMGAGMMPMMGPGMMGSGAPSKPPASPAKAPQPGAEGHEKHH